MDAALSAEGKTATIDKLKAEVDRSMLVAAMTYQSKGMSVRVHPSPLCGVHSSRIDPRSANGLLKYFSSMHA